MTAPESQVPPSASAFGDLAKAMHQTISGVAFPRYPSVAYAGRNVALDESDFSVSPRFPLERAYAHTAANTIRQALRQDGQHEQVTLRAIQKPTIKQFPMLNWVEGVGILATVAGMMLRRPKVALAGMTVLVGVSPVDQINRFNLNRCAPEQAITAPLPTQSIESLYGTDIPISVELTLENVTQAHLKEWTSFTTIGADNTQTLSILKGEPQVFLNSQDRSLGVLRPFKNDGVDTSISIALGQSPYLVTYYDPVEHVSKGSTLTLPFIYTNVGGQVRAEVMSGTQVTETLREFQPYVWDNGMMYKDQFVLVQEQTEQGNVFRIKYANGETYELVLDQTNRPTSIETVVPSGVYNAVFTIPSSQADILSFPTAVVPQSTLSAGSAEAPIPEPTPAVSGAEHAKEILYSPNEYNGGAPQIGDLTISPEGRFVKPDGTTLENIWLAPDGTVHLISPDGEKALPAPTVFIPAGSNELHASQYAVNLDTSTVRTINVTETENQEDYVRMTADQDHEGIWATWMRPGLVRLGLLDENARAGSNSVPFAVTTVEMRWDSDDDGDGVNDVEGARVYAPVGINSIYHWDHPSITADQTGFDQIGYYTRIVAEPGEPTFSVYPVWRVMKDAAPVLFAAFTDTGNINSNLSSLKDFTNPFATFTYNSQRHDMIALPAVSFTEDTNKDEISRTGNTTFTHFIAGNPWDGEAQKNREKILADPNLEGADREIWPVSYVSFYDP